MTTEDGALDEMIRQLAQMPRPDRSYVVEQLGKAEASLIEPRLKRLDVRAMSGAARLQLRLGAIDIDPAAGFTRLREALDAGGADG